MDHVHVWINIDSRVHTTTEHVATPPKSESCTRGSRRSCTSFPRWRDPAHLHKRSIPVCSDALGSTDVESWAPCPICSCFTRSIPGPAISTVYVQGWKSYRTRHPLRPPPLRRIQSVHKIESTKKTEIGKSIAKMESSETIENFMGEKMRRKKNLFGKDEHRTASLASRPPKGEEKKNYSVGDDKD